MKKDESCWAGLNCRPLPYQGSALPLSYNSFDKSGRRDSNPRPTVWKTVALPTELLPLVLLTHRTIAKEQNNVKWAEEDSNLWSRKTADLQSAPFGRSGICPYIKSGINYWNPKPQLFRFRSLIRLLPGATCRNRTNDLLITNQLLYQLS